MIKECAEYVKSLTPKANPQSMVEAGSVRFTLLTERLIRIEENKFTDRATQKVVNRAFDKVGYTVNREGSGLTIETKYLKLKYAGGAISGSTLSVELKGSLDNGNDEQKGQTMCTEFPVPSGNTWHYGEAVRDLRGTARTLDNVNGETELDHGIVSREGYAVLDDSGSFTFNEEGWFEEREATIDLYFFGYGHDYRGALKDFFKLCGMPPELPRFTFGNWWSRFYAYSEETYNELMDRFEREDVPLSVAVIDMDWHITKVPAELGGGWTGYSWNKELFPDPERFLKSLHKRHLHTTINVHPADGVRFYEDCYKDLAEAMGVNPDSREPIKFSPHNKKFMENYFTKIHHPMEKQGVDFWWVDWQQGNKVEGSDIDPLWVLNHTHFIDSKRQGKKGLTFSRYAGPGSHRYPVGFSGDSVTTWESLRFQPYFTANASNIGYTWWSHDIGGHQQGYKNDEMTTRWIQLGVFSPIMRLHSTANAFYSKEPWNYGVEADENIKELLRLRHRLIPYIYTMNHLTHTEGRPLVMPMYYTDDSEAAYKYRNEYTFGTEMIVAPICEEGDRYTGLAGAAGYLPAGRYYDFFTNMIYEGGEQTYYRKKNEMPVFIKEGSILPLAEDYSTSHFKNPENLIVNVYTGADGEFSLYEDDLSDKEDCRAAVTHFVYSESKHELKISIEGDRKVIPDKRFYKINFIGNLQGAKVYGENGKFEVKFTKPVSKKDRIYKLLNEAQVSYDAKENIFRPINMEGDFNKALGIMEKEDIPDSLREALREVFSLK